MGRCPMKGVKRRVERNPKGLVARHTFRERTLCTAQSYQLLMAEALTEFAAIPTISAAEMGDRDYRNITVGRWDGFFTEPRLSEQPSYIARLSGAQNGLGRGDVALFIHARKRFSVGWDSGKGE